MFHPPILAFFSSLLLYNGEALHLRRQGRRRFDWSTLIFYIRATSPAYSSFFLYDSTGATNSFPRLLSHLTTFE